MYPTKVRFLSTRRVGLCKIQKNSNLQALIYKTFLFPLLLMHINRHYFKQKKLLTRLERERSENFMFVMHKEFFCRK